MEKIAIFAIQIAKQSYLNMEISAKYSPDEIEARWYQYWLDKGLFKSNEDIMRVSGIGEKKYGNFADALCPMSGAPVAQAPVAQAPSLPVPKAPAAPAKAPTAPAKAPAAPAKAPAAGSPASSGSILDI